MSDARPRRNGTSAAADPYVAEYPGVCGGYPVIRETRIPVRLVIQFSRDGASLHGRPAITASRDRSRRLGLFLAWVSAGTRS